MNPETDCPICFESYEVETEHAHCLAPCCGQPLCLQCKDCLQRCPFCREPWSDAGDGNTWLRDGYPNPISGVARFCLGNPLLTYTGAQLAWSTGSAAFTGVRSAAASATLLTAEASPIVIGGAAVTLATMAGGAAFYAASRHQEAQSERLCEAIRNRGPRQLVVTRGTTYHSAAAQLFDTVQWYLSPQMKGMPHVYHGSVWRSAAREGHLAQIQQVCTEAPSSYLMCPSDNIWGDLTFCFALWLEYNPHSANWGTCVSYGSPPFGLCWHNRWREDLRHSISDLARRLRSEQVVQHVDATERACAFCLLVALDYILSWKVTSPGFGASDLLQASWYRYHDFCAQLLQQFALAWAVARAPPEQGGIDFSEYDVSMDVNSHIDIMAARCVPDNFHNVWVTSRLLSW